MVFNFGSVEAGFQASLPQTDEHNDCNILEGKEGQGLHSHIGVVESQVALLKCIKEKVVGKRSGKRENEHKCAKTETTRNQ